MIKTLNESTRKDGQSSIPSGHTLVVALIKLFCVALNMTKLCANNATINNLKLARFPGVTVRAYQLQTPDHQP
jgi:hypothetical protein